VVQAINDLDFGIMRQAALLWDWMMRDSRVQAVLSTRMIGLLGLPMQFDPADDSDKAGEIAAELKKEFWRMCPEPALMDIMRWGLGLGVGLGQLIYNKRRDGKWVEQLQPWHPQFMYWDWNRRLFYVVTQNKGNVYIEPDDPEWFLFTPYGMQLGWYKSLIRALFMPWLIRTYVLRDWGRFSEIHGKPMRKAIVPLEASQEDKDSFFRALAYISSETVVRVPRSADGKILFDFELVEAKSESWQGIKELKKDMDDDIAITVLGQALTTALPKASGSFAAAKQSQHTQSLYTKMDGQVLSTFLHEGPLRYWSGWNFAGGDQLVPWARWLTEEGKDLAEKSTTFLNIAQGMETFQKVGLPIDVTATLETFEISQVDNEADEPGLVLGPPLAPPAPATDLGPDDDSNKAERVAARLHALASSLAPQHSGQRFADKVVKATTDAGAGILKRDLKAVIRIVDQSKTYSELRDKMRTAYKKMDPATFAELMKSTLVMMRLAGRGAAK
jgi:phage gp29-like protein